MSVTVLGTTFMTITPDPVGSNSSEIISRSQVTRVIPSQYQERQAGDTEWDYPFNSITILVFHLVDGRKIPLELQTVSNQPGWNNGTMSALGNAQDDVTVWLGGGSLSPSPAILVSPSSRTFSDTVVNAYSTAQTISVSGNNLTNNIILTAPAGWIINLDGSNTNASPITLVQVAGNVAATTVYIKLHPLLVQNYDALLPITSIGALTQNVSLVGSAMMPEINVDDHLFSFDPTEVDFYSTPQSFVVDGSGLYANLVITAPAGFIINQTGTTVDAGPISLVPLAGVVAPTTIYILFKPTLVSSYSVNITCASTDAITENIALDGLGLFPQNRVSSYYHNI